VSEDGQGYGEYAAGGKFAGQHDNEHYRQRRGRREHGPELRRGVLFGRRDGGRPQRHEGEGGDGPVECEGGCRPGAGHQRSADQQPGEAAGLEGAGECGAGPL
jgi:hypothetical protein